MQLTGSRLLRGPHLHGDDPALLAVLDLQGHPPMEADTLAAQVLEQTLALQAQAGLPGLAGRVLPTDGAAPDERRLLCGYAVERVATDALALAVRRVHAGCGSQAYPDDAALAAPLQAWRRRVAAAQPAPPTAALVAAAQARGIPVLRLAEDSSAVQLGWGVRQHRLAASQPASAPPALDALFAPGDDGRIPTVAVTGTNGKTTTTVLIAHVLRTRGARVGHTTTEGVFIDGRCITRGDCSGWQSARSVLMHPEVDAAVLETARGGLLKRGLAFDWCDVGVVLNVSADHLGLDGVHDLDGLARVKGLVAWHARRCAVLNAEDARCVAMRRALAPGCATAFFALNADTPVLTAHLAAGGAGACLHDGRLWWCEHGERTPVAEAAALPMTLGGHARYNVANALAALAALCSLGLPPDVVGAGLRTFVSDARSNPLRGNLFDVGGVQLMVDYAHNVAAYSALCAAARGMVGGIDAHRGRVLGVVTAPGDRRADDLAATGDLCAREFDALVVYEQDPRGRGAGETTEAILAGARRRAPHKPLHGVPPIRQALQRALQLARPGDLVVFACGSGFDDVVEGVRLHDPVAADGIAAAVGGKEPTGA